MASNAAPIAASPAPDSTSAHGEYAPVTGTVSAVNEALADQPDLINSDPYGEGWLIDVQMDDEGELDGLMDAGTYQAQLDEG